jgi:hypothetical protein
MRLITPKWCDQTPVLQQISDHTIIMLITPKQTKHVHKRYVITPWFLFTPKVDVLNYKIFDHTLGYVPHYNRKSHQ